MKAVIRNRLQALGNTLYDAAKIDGQRSNSFLAWPQFAEKEFTQYTRETILKKKRMLEANLGIIGSMIKKVGRYSVGEGLYPIPETTDTEWNEIIREGFVEWATNPTVCDAMGRWSFFDMQRYAAENFFGEGEAFAALVNSAQVESPQVQMFDNFEVRYVGSSGAAPGSLEAGEFTYWDGVKLNRNGKVVAYSIQTTDGGGFVDVDAANMIHVADYKRPNQVRAISPFHGGANSALDALDIKGLEVASIKLHSLLGVVYKKSAGKGVGEAGLSGSLRELLQTATNPDGSGEPTGKTAIAEDFFAGGSIAHLGADEDIKLLTSERPSVNLIEYLEWLYRDVAVSTGLPLEVVWNLSELGGVNARIMLADAQFLFDHIQKKIATAFCRRVYVWWVSVMINKGRIRACADPKWWHCHWQGPCKLNIDRNQVASDISAIEAGLTTYQDYYSARGTNYKPKLMQRILEEKYKMDQCKLVGIPYLTVFPAKPGAAPADAPEDFSGSQNPPAQPAQATAPRPAMLLPPHQQEQFARALNDFNGILTKMKGEADALSLAS
jgi:capsid protein